MKSKKGKRKDAAYIMSSVTDMGNGGSSCSKCHCVLDEYLKKYNKESSLLLDDFLKKKITQEQYLKKSKEAMRCPGCDRFLEYGGTYISTGGSDF